MRNIVRIQLGFLTLLVLAGTVAAQRERTLWSKQDVDPALNVAFSTNGSLLALGREDSNTSDFLNAENGNLMRSFSGQHNTTNDLVFQQGFYQTEAGRNSHSCRLH